MRYILKNIEYLQCDEHTSDLEWKTEKKATHDLLINQDLYDIMKQIN